MDAWICCVCGGAVGSDAPRIDSKLYCAEHYAKVGHERRSLWRSGLASLVGLLVLVVVVALLDLALKARLGGASLVVAGVVLALVPAPLWLSFFYAQDRFEPEPKSYVLGMFLLGSLLASALGIPVVRGLFHVQTWIGTSLLVTLLGSILVVGFVQESLKYAAVRYSIYGSPEFDERMDGILYGAAAGLGYATVLNIHYVIDSGGVNLTIGIIHIVVTALAQASFGGISGYFLARAKFEDEPVWWLPLGLSLAAVLNGLFTVLSGGILRSGSVLGASRLGPWLCLAMATVLATATLVGLLALTRRANAPSVARTRAA